MARDLLPSQLARGGTPGPDDSERKMAMQVLSQTPKAELAPNRSHLDFNRLLAKLPAAAYTCDADGLITYFNERAVELWGREPKLNDVVDRFCGSFRLFSADGSPLPHDECWMALA